MSSAVLARKCCLKLLIIAPDLLFSRVESLAGGDSHLLDKVGGFKARLRAGAR